MVALATSCYKEIPPSDVVGSWLSVREDWVIDTDGSITKESYDAAKAPSDDFAVLQLYHGSLYLFDSNASSAEKSLQMVYSDRFSPLESGSSKHTRVTLSVRLRKQIITGGNAEWVVVSVDDKSMVIDYDSGVLNADGAVVRRKCRFVFKKVGDVVVRG